jgi:hypothetical protein
MAEMTEELKGEALAAYEAIKATMVKISSSPGDTGYTPEEAEDEVAEEMPDVDRDAYVEGMDRYLEEAGVPEDMRAEVIAQLDANGEYDPDGYGQNIIFVIENNEETINNHVDNSIEIGEGAEVDDIHQANDTNQSNAAGDGAIAGRDQEGQFQTGDGVQVGDDNAGVVNQGDNSGQQAGWDATADDFTTGDGNFSNEGHVDNSAVAFGGGAADNQTDQSVDASTNDSFNETDSYNTADTGNTSDSFNVTDEYTETNTVDANLDAKIEDSFKIEVEEEGHGHDGYGHDDDDEYETTELHD